MYKFHKRMNDGLDSTNSVLIKELTKFETHLQIFFHISKNYSVHIVLFCQLRKFKKTIYCIYADGVHTIFDSSSYTNWAYNQLCFQNQLCVFFLYSALNLPLMVG